MKYLIKLLIPIAVITLLLICKNNRLEADISGIEIAPVKFERLDRDLFSITPQNHLTKEKELIEKYGTFYRHFVYTIINANKTNTKNPYDGGEKYRVPLNMEDPSSPDPESTDPASTDSESNPK